MVGIIRKIQWFFGSFSILKVLVSSPKGDHAIVALATGDRLTIETGKSKIDLRYKNGNFLEVLLVPPRYVKKNWEGMNDCS